MRPAWFAWCRLQQGGTPHPAIYLDEPPSRHPPERNLSILAEHEITGPILAEVNESDGDAPWRRLEQAFPPPFPRQSPSQQPKASHD
jgi:hypothetical protein